jgi:hypothetical protein
LQLKISVDNQIGADYAQSLESEVLDFSSDLVCLVPPPGATVALATIEKEDLLLEVFLLTTEQIPNRGDRC